jgi:hypothetical protein
VDFPRPILCAPRHFLEDSPKETPDVGETSGAPPIMEARRHVLQLKTRLEFRERNPSKASKILSKPVL